MATNGIRSILEAFAQPACIGGLRLNVSRAADGRRIRSGMRIEKNFRLQPADALPTTRIRSDQTKVVHHDLSRESCVAFVTIGVIGEASVSLR